MGFSPEIAGSTMRTPRVVTFTVAACFLAFASGSTSTAVRDIPRALEDADDGAGSMGRVEGSIGLVRSWASCASLPAAGDGLGVPFSYCAERVEPSAATLRIDAKAMAVECLRR